MKVLLVSQEMPPDTGWGGIGTYVDVLSEGIASRGVEVHVLSVVDGQTASRTVEKGVTIHRARLPAVYRPAEFSPEAWRRMLLAVSVVRLIPRLGFRPDVIETPEWMGEGLVLGLRGEFPLVVRLHSSAWQLFPHTGQGRSLRGIDGRLAALCEDLSARRANVVVSTRANLDEVAGRLRLDPAATHAIPYPVQPIAPRDRPAGEPPRVVFVGRFEPRKGPDVVLRAAASVLRSVPDARFTFVGRDAVESGTRPSTAWLRAEAQRLGIEASIEFTGWLNRAGVEAQLARATVCAFPSRWESFGNTVAEASAAGRAVVVSAIPAFTDVVVDDMTGRVVSPDDVNAWARALTGLLQDPRQADRMGRAGAVHIARLSDPDRVVGLALAAQEHAIARWRQGARAGRTWPPGLRQRV
jgi:glycosyltransferase involved in cell wall biosynthesis